MLKRLLNTELAPLFLFVIVSLFEISLAVRSTSTMKDQLMKHSIIPDVITYAPLKDIMVEYSKGVLANFGNKLRTPDIQKQPWTQWSADPDLYYSLVMIDPDSPSRETPFNKEMLHWLVVNIPGFDVATGETKAAYLGPEPLKGTGSHRCIFMVFRQQNETIFNETKIDTGDLDARKKFSTRLFIDKYKLGNPWAMNFFHAEYFDEEADKINNDPGIQGKKNRKRMKEALVKHRLIPDFLSGLPVRNLQIEYKGGKIGNYGNTLSPLQMKEKPYVQWSADPEYYYTLVMTDFDAPDPKLHRQREWLHWMVVNIPSFEVAAGDTLTQYVGPHPAADTGFHRYIFTVFSQGNDTIKFNEPLRLRSELKNRRCFSTFKFAEKYNLGPNPWALNFIRVQYHGNHIDPYDDGVDLVTEDENPWEWDRWERDEPPSA